MCLLPLVPHFLWVGQLYGLARLHLTSSALFLGRRGSPTCHAAALHYLCTFSVQGSPACGYRSALLVLLLVPHSLQVGEPHMQTQPSRCAQMHPAIPTGSISGLRGRCARVLGHLPVVAGASSKRVGEEILQQPGGLDRTL